MTDKELKKQQWASRIVTLCNRRWNMHEDALEIEALVEIEIKAITAKQEFLASVQRAEEHLNFAYTTALNKGGVAGCNVEAQEYYSMAMTVYGAKSSLISSIVLCENLTLQAQRTKAGALEYVDLLEDFFIVKMPDGYDGIEVIDFTIALEQAQELLEEAQERLYAIDNEKFNDLIYKSNLTIRFWVEHEVTMRKARRDEAICMINLYNKIITALSHNTDFDHRQAVYEAMEDYSLAINYTRWANNRYEMQIKGEPHNV